MRALLRARSAEPERRHHPGDRSWSRAASRPPHGSADGGFANVVTEPSAAAAPRVVEPASPTAVSPHRGLMALHVLADLADDGALSRAEGIPALAGLLAAQYADGGWSSRTARRRWPPGPCPGPRRSSSGPPWLPESLSSRHRLPRAARRGIRVTGLWPVAAGGTRMGRPPSGLRSRSLPATIPVEARPSRGPYRWSTRSMPRTPTPSIPELERLVERIRERRARR